MGSTRNNTAGPEAQSTSMTEWGPRPARGRNPWAKLVKPNLPLPGEGSAPALPMLATIAIILS